MFLSIGQAASMRLNDETLGAGRLSAAYTSKTSSLSGDVIQAQEFIRDQNIQDAALRSDVFQGRRVKRGLYKDLPTGKEIHADINAAVNILKLH